MKKGLCVLLHKYRSYTGMDVFISEELPGTVWQAGFFWGTWEKMGNKRKTNKQKKGILEGKFKNAIWIQSRSLFLTDKEVNKFMETKKYPPSHKSLRSTTFHLPCVDKMKNTECFFQGDGKMVQSKFTAWCTAQKLADLLSYLSIVSFLLSNRCSFVGLRNK